MNILHINATNRGGAFNGMYRLHLALLKKGINSKVLVKELSSNQKLKEVYQYNRKENHTSFFNRLSTHIGFPVTSHQKSWNLLKNRKGEFEKISFPFSDYDITKSKEYIEADIINLHWTANYLDYNTFFKNCNKPIVLTLRDLFPIQGIFHYEEDLIHNKKIYGPVNDKMYQIKKKALSKYRNSIYIVGISNWITNRSINSEIHHFFNHSVIPNCINLENYKTLTKDEAKKHFNIDKKNIVLSFVSDGATNQRKGIDILTEALASINYSSKIVVLTVGKGFPQKIPNNVIHKHLGALDQHSLSFVYSASDAFIFPSKEEALGNVMLEAMACGTPVIGTPVGGLLDVIKPNFNGLFSKDLSAEGLKNAIIEFIKIKDTFNSENIRAYIKDNFSEEKIANKYNIIYSNILNQQK